MKISLPRVERNETSIVETKVYDRAKKDLAALYSGLPEQPTIYSSHFVVIVEVKQTCKVSANSEDITNFPALK
jgi:hypothetical protein